ncbi:MBL fold metallo-hydrolase [Martelella sp. HB161492]|uniref:MBL fold metallo-hydrolase n=1 Tax=Martelella sp. HB161492 TaxID=2720726 RepID=UPI001590CF75|nr:MBL fold metallo-hydrolase [Martelella sp. HB161492]
MMHHRRIGAADVYNITEIIGPTHDPAVIYPALPAHEFAALAEKLQPAHYAPGNGRLIIGIQIWLVRLGNDVIVIDTGIGNRKPRGLPRFDRLNTLVLAWMEAAGAARDRVTMVINTHLHGDHVGWNTMVDGDGYVPTFANARYLMPRLDYDWWHPRFVAANGVGETEAFTDAVMPLVDAGRVEFYDAGMEFAPGLVARAAYGHTPGQMRIDLESQGARGVFSADIFHSPLQILRPDINTAIDVLPEVARETRAAFLAEMADSGTLVMPCHFGAPHCVRITREGDGYGFVAGEG